MFKLMRTKQAEHDGVRDHENLRDLDQLKAALDFEGWCQDAELAEERHRGHPNLVPDILDTMRRKQQVHSGDRSHPFIRGLDALTPTLSYDGWKDDARTIEWPENERYYYAFQERRGCSNSCAPSRRSTTGSATPKT